MKESTKRSLRVTAIVVETLSTIFIFLVMLIAGAEDDMGVQIYMNEWYMERIVWGLIVAWIARMVRQNIKK